MPTDAVRRPRTQFSLRTFLVVSCALGVGLGVLGQLFFRSPDVFLGVMRLLSTVVPFLLAIGTLFWMGLRGRPAWSAPLCGQCKHDLRPANPDRLRQCPHCGAELTGPKAVLFVHGRGRRWGLLVWASLLVGMPIAGIAVVGVLQRRMGPGPGALGLQTTQQLLQQRLPKQIDQPWVWNELEKRLQEGTLSQQEVDQAIQAFVSHMTTTKPKGWNSPLHSPNRFLNAAAQAGMISDAVLFALCDGFYGLKPVIHPLARLREGQQGLNIEVEYGSVWSGQSGPGLDLLWQVERVLLDGKPVKVPQKYKYRDGWSGYYEGSLKAGDHEVAVELVGAYVDPNKLIGLNTGDLPTDRWPQARKRWTQSVSAPLKVLTPGESVVSLTADPSRKPRPSGGIRIDRLVVQPDRDGRKKVILKVEFAQGLAVPLSYDVAVAIAGQTVKLGQLWMVQSGTSRTQGGTQLEAGVAALDPSIRSADVLLTPNPRPIEHRPEVKEIWGQPTTLQNIPLERLDLEIRPAG